jgi:hypothetical protein
MRHRMFLLGTLVLAFSLVGCGGSTPSAVGDSGTGLDASLADGPFASEAGGDASSADGSPSASDASSPDANEEAGPDCLALGMTTASCRSCCDSSYPAGAKVFDQLTLGCACLVAYCGPPEAGVVDAASADSGDAEDAGTTGADAGTVDAGLYGNAVCTATCNGTAAPDAVCETCIESTLGSLSSPGPCGTMLLGQCLGDPVCNQYLACIGNCPP